MAGARGRPAAPPRALLPALLALSCLAAAPAAAAATDAAWHEPSSGAGDSHHAERATHVLAGLRELQARRQPHTMDALGALTHGESLAALQLQRAPGLQEASKRTSVRKLLQEESEGSEDSNCDALRPKLKPEDEADWEPQPNRYLLAHCNYGTVSHQLACMEGQLLYAGLLHRTLVVPELSFTNEAKDAWEWKLYFDLDHAKNCLGPSTVTSLRQYMGEHSRDDGKAVVNELICWKPDCMSTAEDLAEARPDLVWPTQATTSGLPAEATLESFLLAFGNSNAQLLSIGDVYSTKIKGEPQFYARPFGHFKRSCNIPILPNRTIVGVAVGFVETFTGLLSRGPFDAHALELQLLDSLLASGDDGGEAITLVTLPERCVPPWCCFDSLLAFARIVLLELFISSAQSCGCSSFGPVGGRSLEWSHITGWEFAKFDQKPHASMSLEKLICAMARVFLAGDTSPYSEHIHRLRKAMGSATCADGTLCKDGPRWRSQADRLTS
eukprot:SM000169S02703  [mRNA]  locus=s169:38011:41282:+ [translate_table: standard]